MTTRAELRAALRRRLEDASASPLWDDATLNGALVGAIRAYGARFPREAVVAFAVGTGATRVPVPEPALDPTRIVRVLDGVGATVPAMEGAEEGDGGQAWRWWDGTLILRRPVAAAATWRIEGLLPRADPADDASPVDVAPGDEEIVLALATAAALRRRAVEDAKRGSRPAGIAALAAAADAEADRLLAGRRRRARGGLLG